MARIRKIEIRNFRSIQSLDWFPSSGMNCLVGPGDSGKSTVLDAIDLCLGARRSASFDDTDFYNLDVGAPISVTLTLGDLSDALKNIDDYGDYLRGFHPVTGEIQDEPGKGLETALTIRLTVNSDLEPVWQLISQRAEQGGMKPRSIAWKDRIDTAPTRLGSYAANNLAWSRTSVLNRLADEAANLGPELAQAARQARNTFGSKADTPLAQTITLVNKTANNLGVPIGASAQALLDSHSVSITDGAIALHDANGVPLRSLGTGSSRLLVAGLQRAAAQAAPIVLVDELEFGLEPHRLTRLLHALGAKENPPSLQTFVTTHSPVAVRELTASQLFVVRKDPSSHYIQLASTANDIQATIRSDPETLLARKVIVCEGASEVGFLRGLDIYWTSQGHSSLLSAGVSYANAGGGSPENCFERGKALRQLGYGAAVFLDGDLPIDPAAVAAFTAIGGACYAWASGDALEDALFKHLDDDGVDALIQKAIEFSNEALIDDHIKSFTNGQWTLNAIQAQALGDGHSLAVRALLGQVARKRGWFKSVTKYEAVAHDIVAPRFAQASDDLKNIVTPLYKWCFSG
jgi:putative ATP-dependent endonuclease of the OLD family